MNDNIEKPLGDPGTEREDLLLQKTIQLEKDAARWKREEAALRDMERRYLALAENPLAVLLVLSGERVTYMNRCGETFFDFPFATIHVSQSRILWPPVSAARWKGYCCLQMRRVSGKED